ncbi:hypothetical protein PI124_g13899 [Phytophthora idaei]|nr:hypothetical protein PI125_g13559 [Phytophthora idaei]KAG3147979.1 hypothetical protein PI126_g12648 [Phytophthora idaei]KAG3241222.1 hypothetical protein PI124_g13899 [Phytophthora idaei]
MGNVASTALEKHERKLLEDLEATSYPEKIKKDLCIYYQLGAADAVRCKDKYGHGVSVKFIFTNVSGQHFLGWQGGHIISGKDLSDACTTFPQEIGPLRSGGGFHAKRDAAAVGSFGCVLYGVKDRFDNIKGYIAVAWGQPYWGKFRCHVEVSLTEINAKSVAVKCERMEASDDDIKIDGPDQLTPFIRAYAKPVEGSTAELFVTVKADQIARAIEAFTLD